MRYRVRHPEIAAGVALLAVVGMISMSGMSPAAGYQPYELKKETALSTERHFAELVSDGVVDDQRRAESLISSKLVEGERAAAAAEAERQRKAAAEEASRSAARAAAAAAAPKKKTPPAQTSVATSGGGGDWVERVRLCIRHAESRDNYTARSATGKYTGAYQFSNATWQSTTGTPGPASAYPPAVQDAAFLKLFNGGKGGSQWTTYARCR